MRDRDKLIELLKNQNCDSPMFCDEKCKYSQLESCYEARTADWLLENGVIVPPCKVGVRVYCITLNTKTFTYKIHRGCIGSINITRTGNHISIIHEGLDDEPYFDTIFCDFDDFGKTVFLTKAEAEKALRGEGE